jgi:hypothetical protein
MGLTESKAGEIAEFLSTHSNFGSHNRYIGIEKMQELGLVILDMRDQPDLQQAVWELYCAIDWTFNDTGAFKIIENGHGDAYIRLVTLQQIPIPVAIPERIEEAPLSSQRRPLPSGKKRNGKSKKRR